MLTQGKVWGKTSPIFLKNNVEIHRIECDADTYCSEHLHKHKFNLFFVESGDMQIVEWRDGKEVVRNLTDLQIATVKPDIWHQFRCVKDSIVYEVYWSEFDTYSDKMKFVDYSATSHQNKLIFGKDDTEFYRSNYWEGEVKKDQYHHRVSMYLVEKGEVEVAVHKNDYDLVDRITLTDFQSTRINPGEFYEIKAVKDSVVYEFHWVELCAGDIVRRSVGGS
jgi:mannose-6-phosphate isomerase-like protein (cupin superfamily)